MRLRTVHQFMLMFWLRLQLLEGSELGQALRQKLAAAIAADSAAERPPTGSATGSGATAAAAAPGTSQACASGDPACHARPGHGWSDLWSARHLAGGAVLVSKLAPVCGGCRRHSEPGRHPFPVHASVCRRKIWTWCRGWRRTRKQGAVMGAPRLCLLTKASPLLAACTLSLMLTLVGNLSLPLRAGTRTRGTLASDWGHLLFLAGLCLTGTPALSLGPPMWRAMNKAKGVAHMQAWDLGAVSAVAHGKVGRRGSHPCGHPTWEPFVAPLALAGAWPALGDPPTLRHQGVWGVAPAPPPMA